MLLHMEILNNKFKNKWEQEVYSYPLAQVNMKMHIKAAYLALVVLLMNLSKLIKVNSMQPITKNAIKKYHKNKKFKKYRY